MNFECCMKIRFHLVMCFMFVICLAGAGNSSSIILRLSMFINQRLRIKGLNSENPEDALPFLEDFVRQQHIII